ncbi:MAG: cupin domain-containing protein [Desulfovibrio sp.]|nr:cupin domain-containing protein [Desulfovibrio sp.]
MLEAIQGYRGPEHVSVEDLESSGPFPLGAPNTAYARYFSGKSWLAPISTSQVPLFAVSFEPGSRNSWHVHKASRGGGQVLVVTAGCGYYQEWGGEPVELRPGDVVHIPPNVKHWHGAAPGTAFQHRAIEVPGEDTGTVWEEPVADADYARLA